jgi:hypothetical protein
LIGKFCNNIHLLSNRGCVITNVFECFYRNLEQQITNGQLKLTDEKRVVAEISNLRKNRKIIEGLSSQVSTVENDKQQIDRLRAELDQLNPRRAEINTEFDKIKAELKVIDEEKRKDQGSFSDLLNQKKEMKSEIDKLFDEMKALRNDFKKANDEWYNWERAERDRKQKEYQEAKKKENAEKLAKAAERELELAQLPAFVDEINTCDALVAFLQQYTPGGKPASSSSSTLSATPSAFAATNIRKVDNALPEGAVALKKKDDDENFMVLGKGSKKGKKAASTPAPPTIKSLKIDLATMALFDKLSISIPVNVSDVEECIKSIESKKAEFQSNQEKQTEINKAKAEAKIAAIKAKAEAEGSFAEAITELNGDVEDDA